MRLNNIVNNEAANPLPARRPMSQNEYKLRTFHLSLNLLAHILIGVVVGAILTFAFRNGLPIGATSIHMTLCVLGITLDTGSRFQYNLTLPGTHPHILCWVFSCVYGCVSWSIIYNLKYVLTYEPLQPFCAMVAMYQLLTAQGILSLSPFNGWSAHLRPVDRKRGHWILIHLGAGLAIAGSFVKILDKTEHWNSLHGRFALVALVFTTISVVNGAVALKAPEIRRRVPILAKLSKLTHICFGIIAFGASTITLCYGMEKSFFRAFTGNSIAYTLMAFAACYTSIIIISPLISLVKKIKSN